MKKKINRKPSYKKGGEIWVSDKMANLPKYSLGSEFEDIEPPLDFYNLPQNQASSSNYWGKPLEGFANPSMLPKQVKKTYTNFSLPGLDGKLKTVDSTGNFKKEKIKKIATPEVASTAAKTVMPSNLSRPEIDLEPGIIPSVPTAAINDEVVDAETQKMLDTYALDKQAGVWDSGQNNDEVSQFFNPYGGVDIESRVAYGAHQLGQGNTGKGILGLASGALGLGRIGVGAFAAGKRGQYIKNEYNENVNKALVPSTTAIGRDGGMIDFMQDGGKAEWGQKLPSLYTSLQPQQMRNLRVDGGNTGIRVPANLVDELGNVLDGQEGNLQKYMSESSKQIQNKTKSVQPRQFQEGGEQASPEQIIQAYAQSVQEDPQMIIQELQQLQPEEQQQALQQMAAALQGGQAPQQAPQEFQNGGTLAKKLTGEYTSPLDKDDPRVNAEVEKNEFLQSPSGEITKAEGRTHENGGTPVELEGGTRIVSDHLKLGAQNAKHYKEHFDLEVKASDTYAKVLDKFTKKSGLQKIVDEQERVIEQLKKSEEAAQGSNISESTTNLNKQFLSQKLEELEAAKTPLEEARKALMNDVFNKQEASKPAKEDEGQGQQEFQYGGYKPSGKYGHDNIVVDAYTKPHSTGWLLRESMEDSEEEDKANYNPNYNYKIPATYKSTPNVWQSSGNKNNLIVPVSEYGQPKPPAFPRQKQSWETLPQYQEGGSRDNFALDNGANMEEFDQSIEGMLNTINVYGQAPQFSPEEKLAMKSYYTKIVKDPASKKALDLAIDENRIVFNNGLLQDITTGEKLPLPLQHEKSGSYGGQDADRINNYVYRNTFKQITGQEFKPGNTQNDDLIYNTVVPALKKRGVEYNGAPYSGKITTGYGNVNAAQPGFQDSIQGGSDYSLDMDKWRDLPQEQKIKIAEKLKTPIAKIEERAADPTSKFLRITPPVPQAVATPSPTPTTGIASTVPQELVVRNEEVKKEKGLSLMTMPNQTPMLPDSLTGALKVTRRYDRVNPMQLSADQQIGDLRSQETQAISQINQMPESQRAGAMANLAAITQQNIAKTNSDVNRTNMAQDTQAQQFNAQVQMQEENARAVDLQSYENKIMRAQATTDADIRGYYNHLQKVDLANYNAVNNVNLMNQMYSNYGYDGNSVEQTQGANFNVNQATANGLGTTPQVKKKTTKKRFGGKTK